jgi:hypothetical protein
MLVWGDRLVVAIGCPMTIFVVPKITESESADIKDINRLIAHSTMIARLILVLKCNVNATLLSLYYMCYS